MVMLSPLTHIGVRVHGLLPGTTTRVMGLSNRIVPGLDEGSGRSETIEGREGERHLDSTLVTTLATWGRKAAQRFNERP